MNDTQMEMTMKKFGNVYPLPGTPCKICGKRFDEHEHKTGEYYFDKNICPPDNTMYKRIKPLRKD